MLNKDIVIETITRNIRTLYHVVLLVICTLIFLNVKFLFGFLDYIPQTSIITMLISIAILNELSKMGITTSIDDFGTGYSSLGSLKRFPINNIKIDKSFINEISRDTDIEAIVMAIIAMAHTLKINIIAEGVETQDQLEFLRLNSCDEIQGFIYSPPVTEKEFTELLKGEKLNDIGFG